MTKPSLALGIMATISAALLIIATIAWLSGPWGYDRPAFPQQRNPISPNSTWFLASRNGSLHLIRQRVQSRSDDPAEVADSHRLGFLYIYENGGITYTIRYGPREPDKTFLGFGYDEFRLRRDFQFYQGGPRRLTSTHILDATTIVTPWWFIIILTAILPAIAVRLAFRAHNRRANFRCINCGYDLRATPQRCPECGMVPEDLE